MTTSVDGSHLALDAPPPTTSTDADDALPENGEHLVAEPEPEAKPEPEKLKEEPKPEVKEPTEEEHRAKRAAKAFAELSRREAEAQRREHSVKQLAANVEAAKAELQTKEAKWQQSQADLQALAKRDPVAAVEKFLGMSWDHLVERVVSGQPSKAPHGEEIEALRREFAEKEAAREKKDAEAAEHAKLAQEEAEKAVEAAQAQAVAEGKALAVKFTRENKNKYPLTAVWSDADIAEATYELWDDEHKAYELKNGKPLDFPALLGIIEEKLLAKHREQEDALRATLAAETDAKRTSGTTAPTANSTPGTLTNDLAAERVGSRDAKPGDFSHLDDAAARIRFMKR